MGISKLAIYFLQSSNRVLHFRTARILPARMRPFVTQLCFSFYLSSVILWFIPINIPAHAVSGHI